MSEDHELIGRSTRMEARAIVEGWEMPPQMRRAILAKFGRKLQNPEIKTRELATINRALMQIERVRMQAMELAGESDSAPAPHDPEEALRTLRDDEGYLEYLRQKALTEHASNAQAVASGSD